MNPIWRDRVAVDSYVGRASPSANRSRDHQMGDQPQGSGELGLLGAVVNFRELTYESGSGLYIHQDRPFTGAAIQRYPSGELESIGCCQGGIEHGMSVVWHADGQIAQYSELQNGVLDGEHLEWDEEGEIVTNERYREGTLAHTSADHTVPEVRPQPSPKPGTM